MNTKICYVIKGKHHHDEESEEIKEGVEVIEHKHHISVHMNDKENHSTLKNSDYFKYIAKHGHHFSKELSKYAIEKLYGNEKLTYDKTEEIFRQSDEVLSDGDTIADLYFVVNRMLHRHSSQTIKSDAHIVLLSIESLNDPMSNEVFCEWIECMKRRKEEIPWENFL